MSEEHAEAVSSDWIENLPSLKQFDEATKALLRESTIRKTLPRGVRTGLA